MIFAYCMTDKLKLSSHDESEWPKPPKSMDSEIRAIRLNLVYVK